MTMIIDLSNLGERGFMIRGAVTGDAAGYSVASAGDINGDGFDDVIVGAPLADDSNHYYTYHTGHAYIVYGKSDDFSTVDLGELGSAGVTIIGEREDKSQDQPGNYAGAAVSGAGDVNNDGFADFIVGEQGNRGGHGAAFVIYGSAAGSSFLSLGYLLPAQGFKLIGDGYELAGESVSSAGDVNGDGVDDLIVGAPYAAGLQLGDDERNGKAYVVFGKAGGYEGVHLHAMPAKSGFTIVGDAEGDRAGYSVSAAGDLNDDGFADLIVGAPSYDGAGSAWVIFGKSGRFGQDGVVDLTDLRQADGFVIKGETAEDEAGISVASAGDINGDGFADIIMGAPGNGDGGNGSGSAYVIFGKDGGFGALIDLAAMTPDQGIVIEGDRKYSAAGFSVDSAGDVNGDGFDDLIIGERYSNIGGRLAGRVYVVFGKAGDFGGRIDLGNLADGEGFAIRGDRSLDQTGYSVAAAGDVNGDGFADVIVGAPYGQGSGKAYVIFGVAPTESVHRVGTVIGNTIHGGSGDDTLDGRGGDDALIGGAGADRLLGRGGDDDLEGEDGDDTLIAGVGDDILHGADGEDALFGGRGDDLLYGGAGQDRLNGGEGADVFHFSAAGVGADAAHADRIVDFHQIEHDLIDLSDYDADPSTRTDDPFTFVGTAAFSGAVGELRYAFAHGDTLVSGDTDGDRRADFVIRLSGDVALTSADFLFAAGGVSPGAGHPMLAHAEFVANPMLHWA